MITLESILKEWDEDSFIDPSKISEESIKTGSLHAKYTRYLLDCKERYTMLNARMLELTRIKSKYYRGEMTKDELNEYGWNQYQGPRITKTEISAMINTDDDVIKLTSKLTFIKEMMITLESIIKVINTRSFDIRNHIEYLRFINGLN